MKPARAALVSREQLERCAPGSPLLAVARRKPRRDLEHPEQVKLFEWLADHEMEIPELRLAYAIPNWLGVRTAIHGARLRAEGRKKGMLDVCLPVPRLGFHALYVEMKSEDGQLSSAQRWWLDALRDMGNCVGVARGWESARDFILSYLSGSYL